MVAQTGTQPSAGQLDGSRSPDAVISVSGLVPLWLSLGIVAVMGLVMMAIGIGEFSKTE